MKRFLEGWDKPELSALCMVPLNEINMLREKQGLPRRTTEDLKKALGKELAP